VAVIVAITHCRAALFDLDGVLASSHSFWFELMNDTARAAGCPAIGPAAFAATWGQDTAADAAMFFPTWRAERVQRHYRERGDGFSEFLQVDPQAIEVLATLARRRLRTGLVTNSPRWFVRLFLRRCAVRFGVLVTADDVAAPKPAPDGLLMACRALGVRPAEAVYVGDTQLDRAASRRSGMPFIGLGTAAPLTIDSLAELPSLLALDDAVAREAR
jgi:HAD superfamily hydrolase (TIGR01549 family)